MIDTIDYDGVGGIISDNFYHDSLILMIVDDFYIFQYPWGYIDCDLLEGWW